MAPSKKPKSKVMKDGEFVPPDGGWGWMIVFAAGFSNLSALPVLQQFGLLFRDKFARLGISSAQTTTIINMNSALTSCVGLANGPVFKTFSYRTVSLTGAIFVFISLMLTTFSYNFMTYLISFSILYGAGYGISSSANALALNTYWKNRRRLATSLSWTTTGLGPILWPHIITALFEYFGETGAILVISGISLHAIACALLLQPVEWHSKTAKLKQDEEKLLPEPQASNNTKETDRKTEDSGYFSQMSKIKNLSLFSSQYIYNEDDPVTPGYEIIDPGVPMMIRANDGYFSQSRQSKSRLSSRDGSARNSRMNSKKPSMSNLLENRSRKSSTLYLNESKKNSSANLGSLAVERELKPVSKSKRKTSTTINNLGTQIPESEIEDCPTLKAPQDLKADEKAAVENIDPEKAKYIADKAEQQMAGTKSLKSLKIDGQYGEKYSKDNHSNISLKVQDEIEERKYLKDTHSNQSYRNRHRRKSNNFNYESEVLKQASLKLEQYLKESENDDRFKLVVSKPEQNTLEDKEIEDDEDDEESLTFWEKIIMFFDLDLLKDFTFINLMLGITLANFNELNFSILTPFILGDYGMSKSQTAFFMSLLAGVDICVRFCIPFAAGKIGWDNNSFFLFGVMSMAMGRVVLSICQDYSIVLLVAVMIGFGKGLRTVFMALVIPTHVPLHKLPGATGIQLITAGMVYLSLGPVVGWIKDSASTAVTLHCLNIFTWLTAISWGLEKYFSRKHAKDNTESKLHCEWQNNVYIVIMSGTVNKVPPDGGYGWVVTFAYALNNVVVLPLIAGFGLVFQEAFKDTGLTATQGTLVVILNHGIGMLLSFFGGPVLNRFGYRKVAVVGALLISSGLMLTAVSTSFWLFILSYSIINSAGVAAVMAAFSLAINSFFKEKRGRAIGVGMSITGLGTIYMPLVMSALMYAFGWRYAVLILGAICLHSLIAACLLRPAKWYLINPPVSEEMMPLNNEHNVELINGSVTPSKLSDLHSSLKTEDLQASNGVPPKSLSVGSLKSSNGIENRAAVSHPDVRKKTNDGLLEESKYKWWESQEINLGSSINIFKETKSVVKKNEAVPETNKEISKSYLKRFIDFFDLTLLKDPIFVNILFGLSMASCVETNFSLLLPFILKDMLTFETSEIAKIMAVIGFSDTLFRLVSPFIGEWCHKPPRVMYLVSLVVIIFTRLIMLFTTSFMGMLFVALAMGVTKGVRTVYMNIIIPSYVPLERLPFASGIQMFFNGIVIITLGSLLGRIRDSSGSYHIPILVLNCVTFLTVLFWSGEFLYDRLKKKNSEEATA
ncbi:uncharacterized protein LOC121729039 [Aricia agestis]|uniref:uncharacterized protein LOC121729039 n=1 Tax=Aricia agestis TaxID=91739 RepID=UPI001C204B7C|nr:uncharacterized protein LOC121729039 [Aricia agestis]